jgi:hypothetical protein
VKKWWIWGYWISPLMYAQNAISVNEFLGASWNKVKCFFLFANKKGITFICLVKACHFLLCNRKSLVSQNHLGNSFWNLVGFFLRQNGTGLVWVPCSDMCCYSISSTLSATFLNCEYLVSSALVNKLKVQPKLHPHIFLSLQHLIAINQQFRRRH